MSRVFAVVGPSGAGKDTLMEAVAARLPDVLLVRRVITRPETSGGEVFEGVSEAEFARRLARGDFALHWRAHGLAYGIPATVHDRLAEGRSILFNGSRAMLREAGREFPGLRVIHVTAHPHVLSERLSGRARETAEEIEERLERADLALPDGLEMIEIDNSGALEAAVAKCVGLIRDARG